MLKNFRAVLIAFIIGALIAPAILNAQKKETDNRMEWWREARFGMFIHWGLYSVPAGEWKGKFNHGEWIRTTAQIPLEEYDKFVPQFNPVKFNAEEWVKTAKNAGMKYIVITTKHHDGFCLFDSKYTEFDIMSTPFKRDIMKELSDAAHKEGIKICWYHSIMDWHHPDYLPRREWEKDRSAKGANFRKYVDYMKNQLREIVTKYGDIGVLWFDGEWEATWNHKLGKEIYDFVRSLQPSIIINNRVDVGRSGMAGMTIKGEYAGDFGTPEQEIPATGLPGVDWETCMTMNDHWGYNKSDKNWKSTEDLIRKLADIASKGGNFLLNVGPTSEGLFPIESNAILKEIGEWMSVYGESIYGTEASPFKSLVWGRATRKQINNGTRLYLHVFEWPSDGKLVVPGIFNKPVKSYILGKEDTPLKFERSEDAININLPKNAPSAINTVVVLDVEGRADISNPPVIQAAFNQFIKDLKVTITSDRENVEIRYTTDGSTPGLNSPIVKNPVIVNKTTTITARCFRNGMPVSAPIADSFTKTIPYPALKVENPAKGLKASYYEGDWDKTPEFSTLQPISTEVVKNVTLKGKKKDEYYGFEFTGYIKINSNDIYKFYLESDDGSMLYIDDKLAVDNDGLHGMAEKWGAVPLAAGYHKIKICYFNKTGGNDLKVSFESPKISKQLLPAGILFQ